MGGSAGMGLTLNSRGCPVGFLSATGVPWDHSHVVVENLMGLSWDSHRTPVGLQWYPLGLSWVIDVLIVLKFGTPIELPRVSCDPPRDF